MKITKSTIDGRASSMAGHAPAGGVTVIDSGGYFTGTTLEEILAEIGAGSAPGSFLRTTLGGLDVVQALGTLGATETIDLANASVFWGTLDQNCTITTTGWTNLLNAAIRVELIQDGTGGWTPTFSGVTWIGGTPTWVTTAGTVTHVVLFSRDGGTTIYGVVVGAGSSGTTLPWFIPASATMAALNTAIGLLNAAGKGVLYIPSTLGAITVTADLTSITVPCTVLGDGMLATIINNSSATANTFTATTHGVNFVGLSIINTNAGTPSAGSGIRTGTGGGNFARYIDVRVQGFYIPWNLSYGAEWEMRGCRNIDPVLYSQIQNLDLPDGGDWSMTDCWIGTRKHNGTAGWLMTEAGGGKIVNLKTNQNSVADQGTFGVKRLVTPIKYVGVANTSILKIANSSFENYSGDAISVDGNGNTFDFLSVTGCQFGQYGNGTGRAVYTTGINDVVIDDYSLKADTGTPTAFSLNSGTRAKVGSGTNTGFTTLLATSSMTVVADNTGGVGNSVQIDGTPSSGQVPIASSATAAAWGDSTGHYELLMTGASPPEPIENGAGDDWLYVWVP